MSARDNATRLLVHYFKLAVRHRATVLEEDNVAEIGEIVDQIIDAADEKISAHYPTSDSVRADERVAKNAASILEGALLMASLDGKVNALFEDLKTTTAGAIEVIHGALAKLDTELDRFSSLGADLEKRIEIQRLESNEHQRRIDEHARRLAMLDGIPKEEFPNRRSP